MIYLGSRLFRSCSLGYHGACPTYDIESEQRPAYVDCSCACHEHAANAAWEEERDRSAARHEEFLANVRGIFQGGR
jgi:hypothetical protein